MLGVQGDKNSGWYYIHISHYGLPSTCNWKDFKTPFANLVINLVN